MTLTGTLICRPAFATSIPLNAIYGDTFIPRNATGLGNVAPQVNTTGKKLNYGGSHPNTFGITDKVGGNNSIDQGATTGIAQTWDVKRRSVTAALPLTSKMKKNIFVVSIDVIAPTNVPAYKDKGSLFGFSLSSNGTNQWGKGAWIGVGIGEQRTSKTTSETILHVIDQTTSHQVVHDFKLPSNFNANSGGVNDWNNVKALVNLSTGQMAVYVNDERLGVCIIKNPAPLAYVALDEEFYDQGNNQSAQGYFDNFYVAMAKAGSKSKMIGPKFYYNQFIKKHHGKKPEFPTVSKLPIRIVPFLNKNFNYFLITSSPVLHLKIKSKKDLGARQVVLNIKNYWHQSKYQDSRHVSITNGTNTISIKPKIKQSGYYELHVKIKKGDKTIAHAWMPFALLTNKNPYIGAKSGFGISAHLTRWKKQWHDPKPMSDSFKIQKMAGMSWIRSDQANMKWVKKVAKAGLFPLPIISPKWRYNYPNWINPLAKDTPETKKWAKLGVPKTLSAYAQWTYNTVKKYGRWVHVWELANEPQYWHVLATDYGQVARAGKIAAKLADPNCTVMIAGISALYQPIFRMGIGNVFGAFSMHKYGYFRQYFWGFPVWVNKVKREMRRDGVKNIPIWLTETGGNGFGKFIQPGKTLHQVYHYQALDTPKKLAGSRAAGAAKVFIYNFRNEPVSRLGGQFGMIYSNLLPKPAFMAYRTTALLLARCKPLGRIKMKDKRFKGFVFQTPNGKVAVMWRKDNPPELSSIPTPLPKVHKPVKLEFTSQASQAHVYNLMGASKTISRGADGKVHIGVNEYPVFVTGAVNYKLNKGYEHVTSKQVPAQPLSPIIVRIYPGTHTTFNARALKNTRRLKIIKGKKQRLMVRVYNTTNHTISGKVTINPPTFQRDTGWLVQAARTKLTIPAKSMQTAVFNVTVPKDRPSKQGYILDALFKTLNGHTYHGNAIVHQVNSQS